MRCELVNRIGFLLVEMILDFNVFTRIACVLTGNNNLIVCEGTDDG